MALIDVRVEIDPEGIANNCYNNCVKKVERDGGRVVTGWRHRVDNEGFLKQIQHHAVWQSPDGDLIDITRTVYRTGSVEQLASESMIQFEIDESATFLEGGHCQLGRIEVFGEDPSGLLAKACVWANRSLQSEYLDETNSRERADIQTAKLLIQHRNSFLGQ